MSAIPEHAATTTCHRCSTPNASAAIDAELAAHYASCSRGLANR